MPAYNEDDNIEKVVDDWYRVLEGKSEDSRFVIADTGSTDNTHEILTRLCDRYPKLVILDTSDRYHGPKLMELYKYAIDKGADYIFQTDSDGQTDPNEFEPFWNDRLDYDAVIGQRPNREDGFIRLIVEKVVCILIRMYFGAKLKDANAPFRLMSCESLKEYIYRLPDDYNIPNIMISTYYNVSGRKVSYRNITFKNRQGGKNSINLKNIATIGIKALKDFSSLRSTLR